MTAPWRDLAVVVLAPVAVLALAAGLWLGAGDSDAAATAAEARLAHALSRPAAAPEAQAMALLLPGGTPGLAASAFQALALARVAPSGAAVVEVAAGEAVADAPLTRLHLSLRLNATETQLAQVLVALEGAEPLIAVDQVDAQAGDAGGPLSVTLALSAWAGEVKP